MGEDGVSYGVVKMNVDTDTQWAYWEGLLNFYKKNEGYLQGQIGNPEGEDKPNKNYYDPRKWVRASEESMRDRASRATRTSTRACSELGGRFSGLLRFWPCSPRECRLFGGRLVDC